MKELGSRERERERDVRTSSTHVTAHDGRKDRRIVWVIGPEEREREERGGRRNFAGI